MLLKKTFDNVVIHIAGTDAEWSASVLAKNNGMCYMCASKATPAHIISRRYKNTRRVVENGQPLCVKHHNLFDSLPKEKYVAFARLLVGSMYDVLLKLSNQKEEVVIWGQ